MFSQNFVFAGWGPFEDRVAMCKSKAICPTSVKFDPMKDQPISDRRKPSTSF